MRTPLPCLFFILSLGCGEEKDGAAADSGPATGDSGNPLDTGSEDTGDDLPAPADLAPLSSGECPALDSSGTYSFLSSGDERTVTVLIPQAPSADMPVAFFFHGLLSPDHTPQPTDYMATALGLQGTADAYGAVIVLPESRTMSMFGFSFFMWEVMEQDDLDLVLFDDLRTCVAQELGADMRRVSAMGFSGGGLFTTVVARERGDTLASIVEMSGGSDVDFSLVSDEPIAAYGTPANTMPSLLFSGGRTTSGRRATAW